MDLGTLSFEKLIVHEVPQKGDGEVRLATDLTERDEAVEQFFVGRLRAAVPTAGFDARFLDSTESPVPNGVHALTGGTGDLVGLSQEMARHLHTIQSRANSPGLLVVAVGTVVRSPCVAVLKVERHDGLVVSPEETSAGLRFILSHIRNLVLSDKMRIFKSALFVQTGRHRADIRISVTDDQLTGGKTVAQFFLERFLGCTFAGNPRVQTQSFVDAVKDFANHAELSTEERVGLRVALASELGSSRIAITPRSFARDHVPEGQHEEFLAKLTVHGVPEVRFPKDTELVKSIMRKMTMETEKGIVVVSPIDEVGTTVDVGPERIVVNDRLKSQRPFR
ncbi:nucleoid-associated protein [Sandaracinus amylolyticus]|uniref:nucleoid-associated protein n=1 Tax=Sandaracinus amylolyticus TaxID=927083 RepID=UPI001F2A9E3C|nr:nucleoid-associated protein [Sandaracinus amylolyticus]UJR78525.1 Hypothetical protein I5071_5550 [Sandaracinus amylolyticus]